MASQQELQDALRLERGEYLRTALKLGKIRAEDLADSVSEQEGKTLTQKTGTKDTRPTSERRNTMTDFLEKTYLSQQARTKQWQQAKTTKFQQSREEVASQQQSSCHSVVSFAEEVDNITGLSEYEEEEHVVRMKNSILSRPSWLVKQDAESTDTSIPEKTGRSEKIVEDDSVGDGKSSQESSDAMLATIPLAAANLCVAAREECEEMRKILKGPFFAVGSWDGWTNFEELVAGTGDDGFNFSSLINLRRGSKSEQFQIVYNEDWTKRFHPAADGKIEGPDSSHGVNWQVSVPTDCVSLLITWNPRGARSCEWRCIIASSDEQKVTPATKAPIGGESKLGAEVQRILKEAEGSEKPPNKGTRHQSLDDILMQLDQAESQEREENARLNAMAAEENIDPERLHCVENLETLLERLSRIRKMTKEKLENELCQRGFAVFEGMSRQDLCTHVRDAMVWESLNHLELRLECTSQGFETAEEQPRSELLTLLANATWESKGVPITRLPTTDVGRRILSTFMDIDKYSREEVVQKCLRRGIPTDGKFLSLQRNLKRSAIWDNMSLQELQKECKAECIDDVDMSMDSMSLILLLISSMNEDRLLNWKIPVDRLGRERAEAIMVSLDKLRVMGRLSLQSEMRKNFLRCDAKTDSEEMIARLKEVLILKATDISYLRMECQENGLDRSGTHKDLIYRLTHKRARTDAWNSRCLPLPKDFSMSSTLAQDLHAMEDMDTDELLKRYTEMGYPEEREMQREELLKCLQTLMCWFEMPHKTLEKEVLKHGLVCNPDKEMKDAMVDKLLRQERMDAWERRGYRTKFLGNVEAVLQVVQQTEIFAAMDKAALKECYEKTGFPMGDGSYDYLKLLRDVCTWEAAALKDLEKECKQKGICIASQKFDDDSCKRSFLVQALIVEFMKETYIAKGLPIDTMGIAEATLMVKRFDDYDVFDDVQLQEEFGVYGMACPDDVGRQALVRFLQQMIVWICLPIAKLWSLYEKKGLASDGFDLQMEEAELREQLLARLILQWRAALQRSEQRASSSSEAAVTNSGTQRQAWHYIQLMRDTIMVERVCAIEGKHLPKELALPVSAHDWTPMEAALFVLSSGIFDPSIERRERDQRPEQLISIVCPTCTKRQQFHPLLYATFLRQTYEPKELVVVDTGPVPSSFFMDKMRDDPRVIYRHFIVDDAKVDNHLGKDSAKPAQIAWSLGLKRNIACYLANGVAIAQFDDDDLYAQTYLSWAWSKLQDVAASSQSESSKEFPPVAMKLTGWHLLDVASSTFGYLDSQSHEVPTIHRRGWLYGWGFSYVFSRSAWERHPFPDVEFAEDAGFYEGLMANGVPVSLVDYPEEAKLTGLVAHSHHSGSTSGGSGSFADGMHGFDKSMDAPKHFLSLLPMVRRIHRQMAEESGAMPARLHAKAKPREDTKQNGPLPVLKSGGGVAQEKPKGGLQASHLKAKAPGNLVRRS